MTKSSVPSYINVFTRNAPEPIYCYRSGITVYEERFLDGMLIAGVWKSVTFPTSLLPYPIFPFSAELWKKLGESNNMVPI